MKLPLRLQRRRSAPSRPSVSLFPFLAVLICIMGALVPLLLILTRAARSQAETDARAKAAQEAVRRNAALQTQREDIRWRIEQLKSARRETEAQLAGARLALGHVEDHARRLRERLGQLEKTASEIERLAAADHEQRAAAQAEWLDLQRKIEAERQRLAEKAEDARQRPQSYAVVPYEGPNQTRRRPIYIECLADAVVLQPEGIALVESDFEGPMGPGNPLAASLRAIREHLQAQRAFDPQAGEPYPLLLVRPSGIAAYYAARAALKSWGDDFGYELIGEDWQLAFQPPDAQLAATVRRTLAGARAEQARLIAAAPRQYPNRKVQYRASSNGGFVAERADDDFTGDGIGMGSGNNPSLAIRQRPENAVPKGVDANFAPTASSKGREPEVSGGGAIVANPAYGAPAPPPEGYVAGRPAREPAALTASTDNANAASAGRALRPGEWEPTPEPPPKFPDSNRDNSCEKNKPQCLAARRGEDWALRDAAAGSVGVTRPVRVECYADRLVVRADRNPADDKTVPLGPHTATSIDPFVSAVWEHIERWGIAGRGMYWRPVLQVAVAPDAERRFVELAALLEGSGLTVQRR